MCVFFGIVVLIGDHQIAVFDNALSNRITTLESIQLTRAMKFFTMIGSGIPVTIIAVVAGALFIYLGYRKELVIFSGIIIGSALLNVVLKLIFHRARPTVHRIIEANGYSFPSGHSMGAFTLYGIMTFFLWKHLPGRISRSIVLLLGIGIVVMIGLSRIYLGVHYPSDVIGGYLASGAWLLITISCYQRFLELRWNKKDDYEARKFF
jgi:undecaprenyl-diphosphatase